MAFMESTVNNDITIEQGLRRLNDISKAMEDSKISLDDSLKIYTEGMQLIKICRDKIKEAEQKIEYYAADKDNTEG